VIATDERLAALLPRLKDAPWMALDTEADSLHAYPEKLCLMQISIPHADLILDPLAPVDFTELCDVLRQQELIMHGSDYDLRLLRKSFGFVPGAVFDTMIAARLLGCPEFGLSNLVKSFLGVTLEKGPQKANWGRRPLTPRMEVYARNDTHYLKPLSDLLRGQLEDKGRLGWHQQTCARLIAECSLFKPVDPDMLWRVKGSHQLDLRGLAVLRELWHWREREAVKFNRPPHFVLPAETMVALAEAAVESGPLREMLPRHLTPRRAFEILHAITQGLAAKKLPGLVKAQHYRQNEAEKRRMHELERRRDNRAHELGIDPTLIASRAMLVLLAKDWDHHRQELMPWQRELLSAGQRDVGTPGSAGLSPV
jgi:ribonuclease D